MTTPKRTARLLIQDLCDADIDQVQAVLTHTRHRTFNDWQLVDSGDAELALVGADEPTTVLGMFDEPMVTLQVIHRNARRSGRYGVLVAPLRYVALTEVLIDVDRRLAQRRAGVDSLREAIKARSAQLPPLRRQGDAGLRAVLGGEGRVKLRQRPASNVLQRHGFDPEAAALLTSRLLDMDELIDASRLSRDRVDALLCELHATEMLEIIVSPQSTQDEPSRIVLAQEAAPRDAATEPLRAGDDEPVRARLPPAR